MSQQLSSQLLKSPQRESDIGASQTSMVAEGPRLDASFLDKLSEFNSIVLIIDGVDECDDLNNLRETFCQFSKIEMPRVKILLVSHNEIGDHELAQCYQWTSLFVPFEVLKDDISAYIDERITENPVLRDLHQYTRDKAKAILLKNAEEMSVVADSGGL